MDARLDSDASGFTIVPAKGESLRVRWDDVREIRTYKLDLWCYDEICVGLRLADDGTTSGEGQWVEVTETDKGFRPFCECMERRFPAIPSGWDWTVDMPPFAPCEAVLYRDD